MMRAIFPSFMSKCVLLLLCMLYIIGLAHGEADRKVDTALKENEIYITNKVLLLRKYIKYNSSEDISDAGEKESSKHLEKEMTAEGSTASISSTSFSSTSDADFCAANPCEHGATCISEETSYKCVCSRDFGGRNCSESKWCADGGLEFCGEVECAFDEVTRTGYCRCNDSSKFFDRRSRTCKPVDKCAFMILENKCSKLHEICLDGECHCEKNYKYDELKKFCLPNFCYKSDGSSVCPKNSDCKELGFGNTLCVCRPGYYNKGRLCKKIDLCSPGLSSCQQVCYNGACSCQVGFELNEVNGTCRLIDDGMACSKNCSIGTCVLRKGTEICICPSSSHVNKDGTCVDRCTVEGKAPGGMCPGDKCVPDERHGFTCNCTGFYRQAPDGIHCERKSTCIHEGGNSFCAEKFAMCQEDLAAESAFKCVCHRGYAKDADGVCKRTCDMKDNRDKCAKMLSVCELDKKYEPVCKCPPMLTTNTDGECKEIARNSFTGQLKIFNRNYKVQTNTSGLVLQFIDYAILSKDIDESLKFLYENYGDSKILNCKEQEEFVTCSVELQLNQVPKYQTNSITAPSNCVRLADTVLCWIYPNLILERMDHEVVFNDTNPCSADIRIKLCGNSTTCEALEDKNFICRCKEGFQLVGVHQPVSNRLTLIEKCNDINECLNPSACPDNAQCKNTFGSYECICKGGYRRVGNSSDPKENSCVGLCEPNPCVHGKCEKVGEYEFYCNCQAGYSGYICNSRHGEISKFGNIGDSNMLLAVVGGTLGSVLVLLFIILCLMYRKMKKLKQMQDSRIRTLKVLSEVTSLDQRVEQDTDMRGRGGDRRPNHRPMPDRRERSQKQNRNGIRNGMQSTDEDRSPRRTRTSHGDTSPSAHARQLVY